MEAPTLFYAGAMCIRLSFNLDAASKSKGKHGGGRDC
jgi:hypothetical protein